MSVVVGFISIALALALFDPYPLTGLIVGVAGVYWAFLISEKEQTSWTDAFGVLGVVCMFLSGIYAIVSLLYHAFFT